MSKQNEDKLYYGRVSEKKYWRNLEEYLLFLRHKKTYFFVSQYCNDKVVMDFGCGLGYGSFLLSGVSKKVIGVDIEQAIISQCIKKYKSKNLIFQLIKSNKKTPYIDSFFDIVVSSQVIEHIKDVTSYLIELKRILKANGKLFIITPNRNYRLLPFQKPWNPDHMREYSLEELHKELNIIFDNVDIFGIRGTEEINKIEIKRVRQTPFKAYVLHPLKRLIGIDFYIFLRNKVHFQKENKHKLFVKVELLKKYSLKNFFINKENLDTCLDYFAICKK